MYSRRSKKFSLAVATVAALALVGLMPTSASAATAELGSLPWQVAGSKTVFTACATVSGSTVAVRVTAEADAASKLRLKRLSAVLHTVADDRPKSTERATTVWKRNAATVTVKAAKGAVLTVALTGASRHGIAAAVPSAAAYRLTDERSPFYGGPVVVATSKLPRC